MSDKIPQRCPPNTVRFKVASPKNARRLEGGLEDGAAGITHFNTSVYIYIIRRFAKPISSHGPLGFSYHPIYEENPDNAVTIVILSDNEVKLLYRATLRRRICLTVRPVAGELAPHEGVAVHQLGTFLLCGPRTGSPAADCGSAEYCPSSEGT